MDLQMPELDGLEATAEIRHREAGQGRRTPILALTAHAMDGDQQRCLAAGMDGSITKPMKRIDLYEALARWVAPEPCPGPGPVPTGEPSPDPPATSLPFDHLDDLCGEDRALRAELVQLFRSTVPRLLSGVSAALGREDAPGASTEAHGLKGIAATIGADRLAEPSGALERAARRGDLSAARAAFDRVRDAWAELQPILDAPP
jgi:HPt (histidine-containing phosphotransfer) domain-containing protein